MVWSLELGGPKPEALQGRDDDIGGPAPDDLVEHSDARSVEDLELLIRPVNAQHAVEVEKDNALADAHWLAGVQTKSRKWPPAGQYSRRAGTWTTSRSGYRNAVRRPPYEQPVSRLIVLLRRIAWRTGVCP